MPTHHTLFTPLVRLSPFQPHAYAAVRGFPKRSAAEDFYLLNKIRKVGLVHSLNAQPIQLTMRASKRVPFGTGPAVEKIMTMNDIWQMPTYDPAVFTELRNHLRSHPNTDAFATMKFVHAQRDQHFTNIPLCKALERAPFVPMLPTNALKNACAALAQCEYT